MSRRKRCRRRSRRKKKHCGASGVGSPYARRLAIEQLEDRRMLATIMVDSVLDNFDPEAPATDGAITLREAILAANADAPVGDAPAGAGADTILFDNSLSGQTITLAFGELPITNALTIDATSLAANVTIDANQQSRIFNIDDPTTDEEDFDVTCAGLTLTSGKTFFGQDGGAIRSDSEGQLIINRCNISGNTVGALADGGGIHAIGDVLINASNLYGNLASSSGGAVSSFGSVTVTNSNLHHNQAISEGGAIDAAEVTLTESLVNENTGGGAGGVAAGNFATVIESTLSGNISYGSGGGVRVCCGGVSLYRTTVTGNVAKFGIGGGISANDEVTLEESIVSNNRTEGVSGRGGGITTFRDVTLIRSIVSGNSTLGESSKGGGIQTTRNVILIQSVVSGNSTAGPSAQGGGINADGVTLIKSSVVGNTTTGDDAYGAGISTGDLSLVQSTVSGNSTTGKGAHGSGITATGIATITQSVVTDNHALDINGIGGGIWKSNDPISITSSVLAGNSAGGGMPDIEPGTGAFSVNYSLIGTSITPDAGTSGNNVVTDDPMLGPIFNNGGPTLTHLPLAGSPVLDHIPPGAVPLTGEDAEFDQRGSPFLRTYGAGRDIGAVEFQPNTGAASADFDSDGDRDGIDFLYWQRGFGLTDGAAHTDGDATDDGDVDEYDLKTWETALGHHTSADFDLDGDRDGIDFLYWQRGFGIEDTAYPGHGDANYDGSVTGGDFATWEQEFGKSVVEVSAFSNQSSAIEAPQAAALRVVMGDRAELIDAAVAMELLQGEAVEEETLPRDEPILAERFAVRAKAWERESSRALFIDRVELFLAEFVGEDVPLRLVDEVFEQVGRNKSELFRQFGVEQLSKL